MPYSFINSNAFISNSFSDILLSSILSSNVPSMIDARLGTTTDLAKISPVSKIINNRYTDQQNSNLH